MNLSSMPQAVAASEAVKLIRSGDRVFVHGACATPHPLIEALSLRSDLLGVKLYHLHITGTAPFARPELSERFRSISLFASASLRKPIALGLSDFMPIFLSDIPDLFTSGAIALDVAMVQLSPPDEHGYCSLGVSIDAARSAVDTAKIVIAEINEQMPRTHGNSCIHISKVNAFIKTDRALTEHPVSSESSEEASIGQIVADLIEDRSTLQMGIGNIPNAVLSRLGNKQDLGIHTEMFSDGVIPLIKNGVITNKYKKFMPSQTVTSFVSGTKKLFDFVNNNPTIEFLPCNITNDTATIRKNDRMVALNSAIQIDLSGQVCADSFGHEIYSGIGGQMDFMRGAALSKGGKPIIALPSTAKNGGLSRIVTTLTAGSGVVTTRGHVHWIVTEYGAVNLHGKTLRERAELLISVAHPDFRSELTNEIKAIKHFTF